MPTRSAPKVPAAARELLAKPLDFSEFLAKLSPKDRLNAERRVTTLEAGPDPARADVWRRLGCALMTLAPHAAKFVGQQTVQFYVADGKYRMQVFALEDLQDGNLTVYCPDVLAEATKAGVIAPAAHAEPHLYEIKSAKAPLRVELLDKNAMNPGAHFKDMLGWNRKALRLTVPPGPAPAQVETTELLCAIAATHFAKPAPAAGAAPAKS